jgi:hypothetical protein
LLAIAAVLIAILLWQIREVFVTGKQLLMEPIVMPLLPRPWVDIDNCDTTTTRANLWGDTLVHCSTTSTDHITVRWYLPKNTIRESTVIETALGEPQNTTVHGYTIRTSPPIKYSSTLPEEVSTDRIYVHFIGASSRDKDRPEQWHFQGTGIQFSINGSTVAYAFSFLKDRSGTLVLLHDAYSCVAQIDLHKQ